MKNAEATTAPCPGSGLLGAWHACPVCGRKVTARRTSLGGVVPRHLHPTGDMAGAEERRETALRALLR